VIYLWFYCSASEVVTIYLCIQINYPDAWLSYTHEENSNTVFSFPFQISFVGCIYMDLHKSTDLFLLEIYQSLEFPVKILDCFGTEVLFVYSKQKRSPTAWFHFPWTEMVNWIVYPGICDPGGNCLGKNIPHSNTQHGGLQKLECPKFSLYLPCIGWKIIIVDPELQHLRTGLPGFWAV